MIPRFAVLQPWGERYKKPITALPSPSSFSQSKSPNSQRKPKMRLSIATALSLAASFAVAAEGDACEIYDTKGTCLPTATCKEEGKYSNPGNFCPSDPADIQCCHEDAKPAIPESNCQPHVIEAGNTILEEMPGYAYVMWCYANKSGEHGQGLALDFMVGVRLCPLLEHSCTE